MASYRDFHRRSLAERDAFWAEEAKLVHWQRPFHKLLDYARPPFARWFVGGETNLCYNALDRHLATRAEQTALVWISTEVGESRSFTYRQLSEEVNRVAAMLRSLRVAKGDRVIIYMPMVPEAAFAMLAGAAPIPANSGQVTTRYRLNPYGDRQLNRALHTMVITRITCHQPTRDYIARRTAEGKTGPEIKRCLKRYIARDLYRLLEHGRPTAA